MSSRSEEIVLTTILKVLCQRLPLETLATDPSYLAGLITNCHSAYKQCATGLPLETRTAQPPTLPSISHSARVPALGDRQTYVISALETKTRSRSRAFLEGVGWCSCLNEPGAKGVKHNDLLLAIAGDQAEFAIGCSLREDGDFINIENPEVPA